MKGEWQPIETAPVGLGGLDDRIYLLVCKKGDMPVIAFGCPDGTWDDGDYNDHMTGFTHWMPLPEPPQ